MQFWRRSPGFQLVEAMLEDAAALARGGRQGRARNRHPPRRRRRACATAWSSRDAYASANLVGMVNMLELCRAVKPRHFLFASTSSVYGMSDKPEFVETDTTDRPVSLYAATKKSGEVMAHAYAHLFDIPTTVCRFFTVYGPNGRPDMALFKFVRAILERRADRRLRQGVQERDFTYVGDLVEAMARLVGCVPEVGKPVTAAGVTDTLSPVAPYREVNIAGGRTGRPDALHRDDRGNPWKEGAIEHAAHAAGRRHADDRVSGPAEGADRLQARNQHAGRAPELRRLVQGRNIRQVVEIRPCIGMTRRADVRAEPRCTTDRGHLSPRSRGFFQAAKAGVFG